MAFPMAQKSPAQSRAVVSLKSERNHSTTLEPDFEQAAAFLEQLAPGGTFTFQTFDDDEARKSRDLVRQYHGTLAQHWQALYRLNSQGAGVFVTINATDGQGRKAENVTDSRGVFADFDTEGKATTRLAAIQGALGLLPTLFVESSPGKHHAYWLADDLKLSDFTTLQKALITALGTDPTVKDLPRVMRLPGFIHRKGTPFFTHLLHSDARTSAGAIKQALATHIPIERAQHATQAPQLDAHPYAQRALESATSTVVGAADGSRNDTLNREAHGVFGLVKAGHLPEADARQCLERAGAGAGLSQGEIDATLASAWQAALPREIPERRLQSREDAVNNGDDSDGGDKQAQTDLIVAFVQQHAELFHDTNDETYARHRESGVVRRIGGKAFKHWLTAAFYQAHEKAVRDQSLREARMTLEGLAMTEERDVHIRVAKMDGEYWLDLGESTSSKAVKLRPGHWEIVEHPGNVMFCRSESAHPLPEPVKGGSLDPLWAIVKLPGKWRLLTVAWLVECLRPDTPYPIAEILGEQGSGKSLLQTLLRRLIDPNAADLRSVPKSAEDVFVSGGANHIISIENVSHLTPQLQDALCVVATGGGFAKRKLYSDADETVITLKRPVMLNGIVASVTQQDLVSRTITVELPVLTDAQSKDDLETRFETDRASILGALLDIAAKALTYLPEMTLPANERPRLVEFAYLGMAVAKAMGEEPSTFTKQFKEARQDGLERTLDASPVATAIRDWAETYPGEVQEKTAKQWRALMENYRPQGCDTWPRSDKGMGDALRRAAPALRQLGIECKCLGKIGGSVKWQIGTPHQRKSWNRSPASPEVLDDDRNKQDIRTCRTLVPEKSLAADAFEEF
ncbi:DNA-primase RepB domain-containing protein [Halomonas vilamensis]|uniref:DNA-primase RepB domain-containing protein n=1 Tax=Vreelandella vilamensis TaxID=531309 RepID=A0ABU1H6R1_9GAMM|nr:DNA-primase RepB domain-containing protein [Halomonas vilamensis]MDR5899977.1 DNA-primase RepB domain-containing protein [Halomonas vilamensis]